MVLYNRYIHIKYFNTQIMDTQNRRDFLKVLGATSILAWASYKEGQASDKTGSIAKDNNSLPVWKGFNLLNKFDPSAQSTYSEKDFEWIAEWGFNFVRLPLSYWCWSSEDNWYKVNEKVLKDIDLAVEYAKQYNLHVNLNFHRVPGYCINNAKPLPTNLFEDEEPLKACEYHWKIFAERYKGVPNKLVSFNLINEAPAIETEKYDKVARRLIQTIRNADPDRTIVVDGKDVGRTPLMTLTDVPNIIQSGRGYDPMLISHFRAAWPGDKQLMEYPEEQLSWPLHVDGKVYDKEYLRKQSIDAWQPWVAQGGKVHIGEMGCLNHTPHLIALRWLEDVLSLFKEQGWGWSLWNLDGGFGVLDSNRKDITYEKYKGRLLDRKMLELLKQY